MQALRSEGSGIEVVHNPFAPGMLSIVDGAGRIYRTGIHVHIELSGETYSHGSETVDVAREEVETAVYVLFSVQIGCPGTRATRMTDDGSREGDGRKRNGPVGEVSRTTERTLARRGAFGSV